MSNALSAVLQGLERGAGMGLNIYSTLKQEARADRREQFDRNRAARQDMESDRVYERQVGRDKVADTQWQTNLDFLREKHADAQGIASRQVSVSEGQLGLANSQFQYRKNEDQRARDEQNAAQRFTASLFDAEGNYVTDDAQFAQMAEKDPSLIQNAFDFAVSKGMMSPERARSYSGAKLVPMGDGNFGVLVAGRDGTGKPIRDGGAPMTERGTSDPDDPVMVLNLNQLRQMADPKYREAQRSATLHRDQVESAESTLASREAEVMGSFEDALNQSQAAVSEVEAEIQALQEQRAQAPRQAYTASGREYANPEVKQLDRQIAQREQDLGVARQSLSAITQRMQEVPQKYAEQRESTRASLDRDFQLNGEAYRVNTLANVQNSRAKLPELQRKADSQFESMVSTVISRMPTPKKGEPPLRVSKAEMQSYMYMIPVEQQRKIASDPQYASLLYGTAEFMQRTGFKGNPVYLMEAQQAGADLDAYAEFVQAPQNAKKSPDAVHAEAIEVARAKQAEPSRSLGSIAGGRYLP